MTPEAFYELSKQTANIAGVFKSAHKHLFDYNLTRYKFFVDGSSAGFACTFATGCKEFSEQDGELGKLEEYLESLIKSATGVLNEVRDVRRADSKKR